MSCANEVPAQLLLQDVPEELPSWEFSEDVLAMFDDVLDSVPEPLVSSDTLPTAHDMLAALPGPARPSILQAEEPFNRKSSLQSRPPRDSRKQQNSQAQRRFRQRQKVSSSRHMVAPKTCSASQADFRHADSALSPKGVGGAATLHPVYDVQFLLQAVVGFIEDQSADNEARIQDLKERQRQLEARNALFENFAKLT